MLIFIILPVIAGCGTSTAGPDGTGTAEVSADESVSEKDTEQPAVTTKAADGEVTVPDVEQDPEEISIESVTRQDWSNTVVMWEPSEGETYRIYHADEKDGGYVLAGESNTGSFRDNLSSGKQYFRVERVIGGEPTGKLSEPRAEGYNAHKLEKVYVIMYHNFITEEDEAAGMTFDEYSLRPEEFEQDLIWLKENGYTTITSGMLRDCLRDKEPLPEKAVIISIDDGTYGVYLNAWGLLKKYGMKADVNAIGDRIDAAGTMNEKGKDRRKDPSPFCTWDELKEMSDEGSICICSHTYGQHHKRSTHMGLERIDKETEGEYLDRVGRDFRSFRKRYVEHIRDEDPVTLAYPYSRRSDETDRLILQATGYTFLFGGDYARKGTAANYFVQGCDLMQQYRVISRPCRMRGHGIKEYIERCDADDLKFFQDLKTNS